MTAQETFTPSAVVPHDEVPLAAGLTTAEARARLERDGPNEVLEKRTHPIALFAKKFWGLSAWMLELIAVLSLILHKQADFWIALALLSFAQEQRASAAVVSENPVLQLLLLLNSRIAHGRP